MTTIRAIVKNVAIIGAGSLVLIWWDKRKSAVPNRVRTLAHEAVALQQDNVVDGDGGSSARKKWKEALALSHANSLSPKVLFNLSFALACNLDESGEKELAEQEFKRALQAFPLEYDVHSLEENTRNRVGVTLDRLAQREQDRGRFAEAMVLYDRALDALATPEEVATLNAEFLTRSTHVETIAGILSNVATLYVQLGREESAKQVLDKSDLLMNSLKMSSLNLAPTDESS